MFHPFSIHINGSLYQFGLPLPDKIHHLAVYLHFNTQIPYEDASALKAFLNNVIDRLTCEYVSYNDILIPTSELKKF